MLFSFLFSCDSSVIEMSMVVKRNIENRREQRFFNDKTVDIDTFPFKFKPLMFINKYVLRRVLLRMVKK